MKRIASASQQIKAPPAAVWEVISDIENAADFISAIKSIELIEPGGDGGIIGLKWKEIRVWMGREAVEVMWITDASEPSFYETRAESHGSIYKSRLELTLAPGGSTLTMHFYCQPNTTGARLMWFLTGWIARSSMNKAIAQDLKDIKSAVEST